MRKICDFKLAEKLQASNKKGLIIGLSIGVLIALIAACIYKCCCMKKKFDCLHYDLDDFDDLDDMDDEICDCDENGCNYTSDKDFV
ncbi:MAG: hypothetical protein FWC73_07810 [Defluviitaleaceae bacterium]|nr:hypothetical protein [Defluviitaleaceae bacterium]